MNAGFVLVRICMLERKTLAPGKENVSGRLTMFSSVFTHLNSQCQYVNTSFTIPLCYQIGLQAGNISDLVSPAGEAVRVSEAVAAGVDHQRLLELAAAEAGLGEDQEGGGEAGPHLHYVLFLLLPLHLYTVHHLQHLLRHQPRQLEPSCCQKSSSLPSPALGQVYMCTPEVGFSLG